MGGEVLGTFQAGPQQTRIKKGGRLPRGRATIIAAGRPITPVTLMCFLNRLGLILVSVPRVGYGHGWLSCF
jgi:hypothetical protein